MVLVTHRKTGSATIPWIFLPLLIILLLVVACRMYTLTSEQFNIGRTVFILVIILPILPIIHVMFRAKTHKDRVIAASFLLGILGRHIPKRLSALFVASSIALLGLSTRLSTFTRNQNSSPHPSDAHKKIEPATLWDRVPVKARAVLSCLLLVIVMLTENFFIWAVSSTYTASHQKPYPTPLQDNGQIILHYLYSFVGDDAHVYGSWLQLCRDGLNISWALVSAAGVSIVITDIGMVPKTNVWTLGTHHVLTLAFVRLLRTISFSVTVLPSQIMGCYHRRFGSFQSTPTTFSKEWFVIGFTPRTKGGCNDLIISGHATITSILACLTLYVARNQTLTMAIWTLLCIDFCFEVFQGYHYSIDMMLGLVITWLIHRVLWPSGERPHSDHNDFFHSQVRGNFKFASLKQFTTRDVFVYTLPCLLAFYCIAYHPFNPNIFIVLSGIVSGVCQWRGHEQYAKHVLLCTLFLAIATYL